MKKLGIRLEYKWTDNTWDDGPPPSGSASRRYRKAAFHSFLRRTAALQVEEQLDPVETDPYHHPRRRASEAEREANRHDRWRRMIAGWSGRGYKPPHPDDGVNRVELARLFASRA